MKKKIAILGSTGSIGKSALELIDLKKFEIHLLTANKNYKEILKQARIFKVKNIIIKDPGSFEKSLRYNKNKNIKIYNNFLNFDKIFNKKLDYVLSSISGIGGLLPTFNIIRFTKKIAIANKESLICAWPIIKKELKKNRTKFAPVDSEHFSIWCEINNIDISKIKKIYLTASGGPLLNVKKSFFGKIDMKTILKHPTWKMGRKITVDSATMMNKCFEVMEAKNIFDLDYSKIDIIIHPNSYVHAIVVYNSGISKIITHETSMKIPIFNTIYTENEIYRKSNDINFKELNNLNFQKVMLDKFPLISILKKIPKKHSMFETILVSINDCVVDKYLNQKISFIEISKIIIKLINSNKFKRYKNIYPSNINQIIELNKKIDAQISRMIN